MILRKIFWFLAEPLLNERGDTLGQLAGGIGGAIIGALIPGVGPIIGFTIGLAIGSFIDPPSIDEPSQSPITFQDIQFNTFRRNLPVPLVYGSNRVGGNILWLGNTRSEIVERDAGGGGGGKGGGGPDPPKVREVWYSADFAMGLSEGEIQGVTKVLIDEEDISNREGLNWFAKNGTETEAQDSRIVSALGAATAPFFRRTAHLMVTGRLGQVNRIPVVQADVVGILAGDPIFTDIFSRSNANSLGVDWQILTGSGFQVTGNQAATFDPTVSRLSRVRVTSAAYSPREDMRVAMTVGNFDPGGELFGLDVRIQSGGAAYSVVASVPSGAKVVGTLVRWTNQETYTPISSSYPIHLYKGHELAVRIDGNQIFGEVGGRPFASASDSTITGPGFAGMWGQSDGASLKLDRFSAGRPITRVVSKQFSDGFNVASFSTLSSYWINHGVLTLAQFPAGWRMNSLEAQPLVGSNPQRATTIPGVLDAHMNQTISVRVVKPNQGLSTSGAIDPANAYGLQTRVLQDDQAYAAYFWRTDVGCFTKHNVMLVRYTNDQTYTVVASPQNTNVGCGNTISLEAIENVISAKVGATTVLQATDTNISTPGGAGLVHLTTGGGQIAIFDDAFATTEAFGATFANATEASPANPVWVVRDLLVNVRYGLGLSESKIDQPSFEVSASYCDELVENADGTFEKRFELDIVLDTQRPVLDHLRDILSTFRGFLVWSQGVVKMRIEKAEDVSQSFTMDSIVADSFVWRKQSYRDRPNVVRVEYINKNDEYRHDFVETFDDWDIDLSGERRERILRLLGIKRTTQAVRMAQFYLDQAIHISNIAAFRVGISALKAEVGDIVDVTHDVPGWVVKKFRIIQMNEAENDEIALTCLEYNASIYHDQGVETQNPYGQLIINPLEVPWHVIRLTSHKRPNESVVEASFTRANSSDQFAGAMMFRRRWSGDFEELDSTLAAGPTAFLDSRVQTVVQNSGGVTTVTSLFSDLFDRANEALQANSRWQDQIGSYSLVNCAVEFPLLTSSRCVSRVLSGAASLNARDSRQQLDVKFGVLPTSGSIIENGLLSRFADTSNFYAAIMGVQSGGADTKYLRLLKRVAGADSSFVPPTSFGVVAGQVYTMKYEVRSFYHRLYVDNSLWITAIDCSLVGSNASGLFGQIFSTVGSTGAYTKDNYHYRDVPFGDLEIRGIPDRWGVSVFDSSSVTIASAVGSDGSALVPLTDVVASGFINIFKDSSFSVQAPSGRYPGTGNSSLNPAGLYTYDRQAQFVTATQTFVPIYNPLGGFANVGSARMNTEQFGYSTFTDSRLEGATRGAGGTTAISHTAILSLGALAMGSGGGLADITSAGRDPISNVVLFQENSVHLYFGASSKFARIEAILARNASTPLSLAWEYSIGDATWASLVESGFLGPTDQTSGFTQSGKILVEPPGDWAPTNKATLTTTLTDGTSRYYLRAMRTNTAMTTAPKELMFTLDGETVVSVRKSSMFEYATVLADSGTALSFKAISVGLRGQLAEGTKAPITNPTTV